MIFARIRGALPLLLVLLNSPHCVRASDPAQRQPRRFALLIGVNKYNPATTKGMAGLTYADGDARRLGDSLAASGFSRDGIVVMNTAVPRESPRYAIATNIRKQLKAFVARLQEGDSVVFGFAGYEMQFADDDDYYLCPSDCDVDDTHTMISLREVCTLLGRSKAANRLVIVDSCRGREKPGQAPTPRLGDANVGVLFACSAGQISFENDKLRSGYLANFLIEGLRAGADADQDGTITVGELYAYARARVAAYSNNEQVPEFLGAVPPIEFKPARAGGEINPSGAQPPVPAPPRPDAQPRSPNPGAGDEAGFNSIFNGRDLSGWRVDRGDPDIWHVEDGVLVAAADGDWRKQNFLLSDRDFSNFVLRFEFQIPKNADSGIALLASPGEHHLEVNLRNFEEPPGLHAQTAALRWSTSGNGRDYLPPDQPADLGFDQSWNEARIELRDGSLQVWVNGRQVRNTDLRQLAARPNSLPALKREAGRIGFQSHTGTVRFRNIQIKSLVASDPPIPMRASEPEDSGDFRPLFNGRDLTGWTPHPTQPGGWRVENGILIGSGPAVSHLYSERGDYKDFHLRVHARINGGGNSGVYFRAPFGPTIPENNPKWLAAYNAKLDEKRFGLLIVDGAFARPPLGDRILVFQPDQWITQEIIVRGNHIEIKINGTKTTDYTDQERHYSVGHIVLQQHGPQTVAEFRKIEIKELGSGSGPSLYVLSIGINDYPDKRLKLDSAAPDARDIRQAFLTHSRRQFPGGVEARMLLDTQATRANILEGLQWLAGKAKGNDVAVVFYAGHGDSQIEGQFYLVPFDANLRKLGVSGVSGESLRKALGELPCTTMLILDACDSGGFDAKATKTRKTRGLPTATDTMLKQMVNDEGLVVMCGAAKGKEAAEENGHGFFTRAIVDGLSGKADFFKKGRVELYDLQAYVKTRVGQLSGDEQEPTISIPSTIRSFPLSKS